MLMIARKGYVTKGDFLINLAAMPIKEKRNGKYYEFQKSNNQNYTILKPSCKKLNKTVFVLNFNLSLKK
jgi:hypothetical protein